MKPADRAWLGLAAAVLGYEAAAVRGNWELLSEACDRYRGRHPVLTTAVVVYLAAHLTRAIPRHCDPLHITARWVRP